jgi:hypothetical protein
VLLTLEIPLKTTLDIEDAVVTVTKAIQAAAWQATADREDTCITIRCPIKLKEKLHEKRRARQRWQLTKSPADKQTYSRNLKN